MNTSVQLLGHQIFFYNLELPYVHLFQYHTVSQLGNISYVWKSLESESDREGIGSGLLLGASRGTCQYPHRKHNTPAHSLITP